MPKISKAKTSKAKVATKVSPKVPPTKTLEGVGIVKLGDVSAPATWSSADGWIEIICDTAKLSPDRLRDLERYRSSSRPIDVQLPGDEEAVSCVVIGFERHAAKAAFYLAKAGKR